MANYCYMSIVLAFFYTSNVATKFRSGRKEKITGEPSIFFLGGGGVGRQFVVKIKWVRGQGQGWAQVGLRGQGQGWAQVRVRVGLGSGDGVRD